MSSSSKNYKYPIIADNFYELFGLTPFSDFSESKLRDAYDGRYQYWKSISQAEMMADKSAAMDELIKARKVLLHKLEKQRYDRMLKNKLLARLDDVIEAYIKTDNELDPEEEKNITSKGKSLGFTEDEIEKRITDQLKKHGAKKVPQKSTQETAPSPQHAPAQQTHTPYPPIRTLRITSTGLATAGAGLYSIYLIKFASLAIIGNWAVITAAILCGIGLISIFGNRPFGWVAIVIGATFLAFANLKLLFVFFPVPLTWWISNPIFKKNPDKALVVWILPISFFILSLSSFEIVKGNIPSLDLKSYLPSFTKRKPESEIPQGTRYINARNGANIRSGPSKRYKSLKVGAYGEKVKLLEVEKGWCKIYFKDSGQNKIGFIHNSLLTSEGNFSRSVKPKKVPQQKAPVLERSTPDKVENEKPTNKDREQINTEEKVKPLEEEQKANNIQITVRSLPSGATVFIEGERKGTTPLEVEIASEDVSLILKHVGYKDLKKRISPNNNEKTFYLQMERELDLKGRWRGRFSEKELEIVIDYFNGSTITGYDKVKWNENSNPQKIQFKGTVDKNTRQIKLVEQGEQFSNGVFTGSISEDGKSMAGTWKRSKGTAQVYNWKVQKR